MIYGDTCTGISAATVAWHPLGWRPAWFSEIEPFPCKLLKHHYPDVPNLGDMMALTENKIFNESIIDLLVGGTPCQSFSLAGLRGGLADGRGNLALQYCRLLIARRPRWFVWENVPGVFSSFSGEAPDGEPVWETSDFATLLTAFRECGYSCCWRVLDSQYFGVPQRRRRVFVIGYFGDDWRPPAAVLLEPESVRGNITPIKQTGQEIAGALIARASGGGFPDSMSGYAIPPVQKIVGALGAKQNRFGVTEVDAGQFIPVNLPEKAGALDTQCGGEKLTGQSAAMGHLIAGTWWDGSQVSQTLDAVLYKGQTMPEKNRFPAVLVPSETQGPVVSPTLTAYNLDSRSPQSSEQQRIVAAVHATNMAIRRLTPLECERLQGFPDDYTKIPGAADGPRYKALGNSMTVHVMHWIGRRIQIVDKILNH